MFESWLSIVNVSSWQAIQLSWASVSLLIVVQISMSQNCYKNEKKECIGQQLCQAFTGTLAQYYFTQSLCKNWNCNCSFTVSAFPFF